MNRRLLRVLSLIAANSFINFLTTVRRLIFYCFVDNAGYLPSIPPPPLGPGEEIRGYDKWCNAKYNQAPAVYDAFTIKYWPLFSIVVPVYNSDANWLNACINSVRSQCYAKWELILSNDGSTVTHIDSLLAAAKKKDDRIRVLENRVRCGISKATNKGVRIARGDYIVFLDHDDILDFYALKAFAIAINENMKKGKVDIIYADEDFMMEEKEAIRTPSFKSNYSPDLLLSTNYMHHPVAIRRKIFQQIGGLRCQYDGSQDHDLLLRASEICDLIVHVPDILYHTRMHKGSLASGPEAKPEAHFRDRQLIQEALHRRGITGEVVQSSYGHPGQNVIRLKLIESPSISVLLVPENLNGTEEFYTVWGNYECIIGDQELPIAQQINQMAHKASGQILIVASSQIRPESEWDNTVVPHLMRPEIGLVSGKITYSDDTLFSCGLFLGLNGTSGAWHRYWYSKQPGISHWLASDHEVSAVPWHFMGVRRDLFLSMGGFNVDFCENGFVEDFALKLTTQKRLRHLVITEAEMKFVEGYSKQIADWNENDRESLWTKWRTYMEKGDPYINPNFSRNHLDVLITENFRPDFCAHWWWDMQAKRTRFLKK